VTQPEWQHEESGGKILSFFDADAASKALEMNSFSIEEEIATLVQHLRDPDAKIALRAHNQLRRVLNEVAKANGLITTQEYTATDKEGNQSVRITRNQKLLSNLKATTHRSQIPENPDFAAQYLAPSKSDSEADEANGTDGNGEIGGSSTIRLGD
tara:strand:- start:11125 stop:11589 length:465 start_codon:yes stop_codon:yes gene_type:complete